MGVNAQQDRCRLPSGTFTVRDALTKADATVTRLDADLDLTCLDGQRTRFVIRIGTTGAPWSATVTPPISDVGPVYLTQHWQLSVPFTNVGNTAAPLGPVRLEQPADSGAPWSFQSYCPAALAPGATCTVQLDFRPNRTWSGTSTLVLPGGGLNEDRTVALVATGGPDVTPPVVHIGYDPPFVSSPYWYAGQWGDDEGVGLATMDLRWRASAPTSLAYSAYIYPGAFQHKDMFTPTTLTLRQGIEYCFSIRARDLVGNVSTWSPDHCTEYYLDDAHLRAITRGWTRYVWRSPGAYIEGTVSKATAYGAALAVGPVRTRRIQLLVTTCPTCGYADVYFGTTRVGRVNTYSARVHYFVARPAVLFSRVRYGTVRIVNASRGRVLYVDGIGLSRS
jgi:hypothetical protein